MEYHIFKQSIVFSFDDERDNITVNDSDEHYVKIKTLLEGNTKSKLIVIEKIISSPMEAITTALTDIKGFSIDRNVITYNNKPVEPFLGSKILEFRNAKKPYEYILKFYERVIQNPSENSQKQLFKFLVHNEFPFTEDGKFIAFKSVKQNFTDHYSGKINCSIGTIVEMTRDQVEDDPCSACSTGLHVGTYSYANGFGANGVMVAMLVDPKDVVSVPNDSNHQKCRCCRYEVLSTVTAPFLKGQLVVISDMEKALKLPSTKKKEVKKVISTQDSIVIINKTPYEIGMLRQSDLDRKKKTSIQPSKRMKFFKDMGKTISQMWKDVAAGIFYVKTNKNDINSYTPTKLEDSDKTVVESVKKKADSKTKDKTPRSKGKKEVKTVTEKKGMVVIAKKKFKVTMITEATFKKAKDIKSVNPSARNAYFKSLEVIDCMWKNKTEFYVLTHDGKYVKYTLVKK